MSQRRARQMFNLSLLEWRRFGVTILQRIKTRDLDTESFVTFVKDEFGEVVSGSRLQPLGDAFSQLQDFVVAGLNPSESERCSSINRAKGLEADAILVIAKSPNRLKKWLVIDGNERQVDKQDKCRLGYVAFTRPREMLCIACLKQIDAATRQMLTDRGVTQCTPKSTT